MDQGSEIDGWRRKIDELDRHLLELINRRAEYALEIGRIKRLAGLPVYSPDREEAIRGNITRHNPGPLSEAAIKRLFDLIIDETRRLESEVCEKGVDDGN
jgi:chorismate mutase